jgi:hypothetical protein
MKNKVVDSQNKVADYKNKVMDSQNKVVDWEIGDSPSKLLRESPIIILIFWKLNEVVPCPVTLRVTQNIQSASQFSLFTGTQPSN